jgi:biofilm PGA synthesis N-glycosyltransferase PgaC
LDKMKYALITAARNEGKYLENTIKTIIAQTLLPVKWIIVSDGSTDKTNEIVLQYSAHYNFIALANKTATVNRRVDFSSKVHAIKMGYQKLQGIDYSFIGILDGDVTFDSCYYENILKKFVDNPKLGIAGGIILDQYDNHCVRRSPRKFNYVSGCIQLFRRECYEAIGGLTPIEEGGEDTIAAITVQMKGWEVEAFEELNVYHHKHSTSSRGGINESLREGRMFYALGSHPLFEIIKNLSKIVEKPYFLHPFIRLFGYLWPFVRRQKRQVSDEFIRFLRKQQFDQLKAIFSKKIVK